MKTITLNGQTYNIVAVHTKLIHDESICKRYMFTLEKNGEYFSVYSDKPDTYAPVRRYEGTRQTREQALKDLGWTEEERENYQRELQYWNSQAATGEPVPYSI